MGVEGAEGSRGGISTGVDGMRGGLGRRGGGGDGVGGSCSPVTRRTSTSARNDAMCLLHDSMSDDERYRDHTKTCFSYLF